MKKLAIATAAALTALAAVCAWGAVPFANSPDWESADNRSTMGVALADFNGDGWQTTTGERKTGDGDRHVFYLDHYPALTITALRVKGAAVPRADYCFDSRAGWFSLKNAPADGARVEVDYKWSNRLDFFAGNENRDQRDYRDAVYFNRDGALEKTPSWLSTSRENSWRVKEADYDADGDVDVAVGYNESLKIYKNTGTGLEGTPSWSTSFPGGWVQQFAWGDVDNDGYLELAVADMGSSFKLYKNNAGTLEKTPSWSATYEYPYCVAWGDVDGDGDMDLAGGTYADTVTSGGFMYLFENNNGSLASTHYWQNDPPRGRCSAPAWGDVNGDGWLDLLKGICGRGGMEQDPYADIYYSDRGVLPKKPSWESGYYAFCNNSCFADADADGLLDLIQSTGGCITGYFHERGTLTKQPTWDVSLDPSGTFDCRVGDVDADGYPDVAVACVVVPGYPTSGPNQLFLNRCDIGVHVKNFTAAPASKAVALRWEVNEAVGGFNLLREVKAANAATEPAKINDKLITGRSPYRYLDADVIPGTPYRYWLEVVPLAGPAELHGPAECTVGRKASFALAQNVPNPARSVTTVAFSVPATCDATLAIYDLAGRKVASRVVSAKAGGNEVEVDLSSLAPGVYTYRLEAAGEAASKRMVVIR
jgi:hypothetical protein